jgi:hypothetical protein
MQTFILPLCIIYVFYDIYVTNIKSHTSYFIVGLLLRQMWYCLFLGQVYIAVHS